MNADTKWFDNTTAATSEWLRKEFDLYEGQDKNVDSEIVL